MTSDSKVSQSNQDLQEQLKEQIHFLQTSVEAYDSGSTAEAKRIAVTLRLLLHNTSQSHALLDQLDLLNTLLFYDTSMPVTTENMSPQCGLVVVSINPSKLEYVPYLDSKPDGLSTRVSFDSWWNKIVVIDTSRRSLTRRELVLYVADQDGGAHVDPKLDKIYADLSRHNSLGWTGIIGEGNQAMAPMIPIEGPERAALRQIAHEVLKTLVPQYSKLMPSRPPRFLTTSLEIMEVTEGKSRTKKVGRNALCPCGSGKKYKYCCGKPKSSRSLKQ